MKKYEQLLIFLLVGVFAATVGYRIGKSQAKPVVEVAVAPAESSPSPPSTERGQADRIIAAGHKYKDMLGKAYGDAWTVGADRLDHNVPLGDVMKEVGKEWQAGRDKAYRATVGLRLNEFIPEGTADKDVTATQRAHLAATFRKFAQGLSE